MKLDLQLFGKSEPKTVAPKLKAGSEVKASEKNHASQRAC
jgi:hypothetical protein